MRNLCKILSIVLLFSLTGCASFFGNASYQYVKQVDGSCEITINSGRNLPEGAFAEIENCNLKVTTPSLSQGTSQSDLASSVLTLLLQNPTLLKQPVENNDPD
jgi:hypothetical protein